MSPRSRDPATDTPNLFEQAEYMPATHRRERASVGMAIEGGFHLDPPFCAVKFPDVKGYGNIGATSGWRLFDGCFELSFAHFT